MKHRIGSKRIRLRHVSIIFFLPAPVSDRRFHLPGRNRQNHVVGKYDFKLEDANAEFKWHASDANAAAKYGPSANSSGMRTAKIKVINLPLGPDGSFHAQSAFEGSPNYDADSAISVSQEFMDENGWRHQSMTNEQHDLYTDLAQRGAPNTMVEQDQIAYKALRAGGANPLEAWILVQKSAANLLQQGVQGPIHIPWH